MSRLGKLPVTIPSGVTAELDEAVLRVKGPKGELSLPVNSNVSISFDEGSATVAPANDTREARAMWGMTRTIFNNLVTGVTEGFTKTLEVNGVGYRVAADNQQVTLTLGYSHEIIYVIPEGIEIKCPKPTQIVISGVCKQKVGQVAAEIRALRKPEPYKGKGIRYEGEHIRMKEGKKK